MVHPLLEAAEERMGAVLGVFGHKWLVRTPWRGGSGMISAYHEGCGGMDSAMGSGRKGKPRPVALLLWNGSVKREQK